MTENMNMEIMIKPAGIINTPYKGSEVFSVDLFLKIQNTAYLPYAVRIGRIIFME